MFSLSGMFIDKEACSVCIVTSKATAVGSRVGESQLRFISRAAEDQMKSASTPVLSLNTYTMQFLFSESTQQI